MDLCSTQPLTEMSTRAISWGWRCSPGCNFPNFMCWLSGNSGEPQPPAPLGACTGLYRDGCTFGLMNDWNYGGICTLTLLVWKLEDVRCFIFVAQCTNFLCMQEVCKLMNSFMVRPEIQLSLMCIFFLLVMLKLVLLTRLKVNAACCTCLSLYSDPFWCLILPTWLHACYFLDR